ncbi:hypothetical protein BKA64DRAFT_768233 [Cadophora sp. MPI-SDFR-AT-0126]|nr:hypothetical protein BKA64DRAFT_768233 [Leotiomycetes sp. MPI-SDFR-AT-0126]
MSPLPAEGLTLHGGCDCSHILYTITIPPLSSRPIAFTDKDTGEAHHFPQSFLDHCNRCRRVSGSLIPAWLTVPQDWVTWTLTSLSPSNSVQPWTCTTRDLVTLHDSDKRGEKSEYSVRNYISSPGIRRSFCGDCGTNLAFVNLERNLGGDGDGRVATVDVVLGSLERSSLEVEGVWPGRHEYWDSGVEWIRRLVTEGDGVLRAGGVEKVPRHPEGEWDVVV